MKVALLLLVVACTEGAHTAEHPAPSSPPARVSDPAASTPVRDVADLARVARPATVRGVVERAERSPVVWGGPVTLLRLTGATPWRVVLHPAPDHLPNGDTVTLAGRLRVLDHTEGPIVDAAGAALPVTMVLESPMPAVDEQPIRTGADVIAFLRDRPVAVHGVLQGSGGELTLSLGPERCLRTVPVAEAAHELASVVGQRVVLEGTLRPWEVTGAEGCIPVLGVALTQPTLRTVSSRAVRP